MQLTDEQKQKVAGWIADGMKLSDIQGRLGNEFGVRLTYMDVRLLVDDLKLTPKDAPLPEPAAAAAELETKIPEAAAPTPSLLSDASSAPGVKLTLAVDQVARPGTFVSGSVTFTDGKTAGWHLDQTGRLGLVPPEPGYRPPDGDLENFQVTLDRELQKMGY
jgi:hypothetical protein